PIPKTTVCANDFSMVLSPESRSAQLRSKCKDLPQETQQYQIPDSESSVSPEQIRLKGRGRGRGRGLLRGHGAFGLLPRHAHVARLAAIQSVPADVLPEQVRDHLRHPSRSPHAIAEPDVFQFPAVRFPQVVLHLPRAFGKVAPQTLEEHRLHRAGLTQQGVEREARSELGRTCEHLRYVGVVPIQYTSTTCNTRHYACKP